MIIVQDSFVCKPGNASRVAKMFREAMAGSPGLMHVMTDVTGQYHRVIIISGYNNLADYEKHIDAMSNPTPEMKGMMKKMEGFQEMYLTGSREIYRTW